jgi:hypothetical protein
MVSARALHPAERRRLTALMPLELPHEVQLVPLGGGGPERPIVSIGEQNFLDALLADLARTDWRAALDKRRALRRGTDHILELSQPVHRTFHVVVMEVDCVQPGSPRLDPAKIDSMGLVIRRAGPNGPQGWMADGPKKLGWADIAGRDLDPDPDRRGWTAPTSSGQITAMVLARRGLSTIREDVLPMFPAPRDLCDKIGRTILYGLVPVTSAERADVTASAPNYRALPGEDDTAMRQHFSEYLKPRPTLSMPNAGVALDPSWQPLNLNVNAGTDQARLNAFGIFLQQLMTELGAFDAPNGDMVRLLNQIALPMEQDSFGQVTRTMPAGDFCQAAAAILIGGDANAGAGGFNPLTMPLAWPAISAGLGEQLTTQALASLGRRFSTLAPGTPKYDGRAPKYSVRPFIRVKGHDHCPAKLVWANPTELFRVLPWWDGDGPATIIPLPDPRDFKKMKPNVSFQVPDSLAALLRADPKTTLKDGPSGGGGIGVMWLCSFSIPIITICAFLVLGIFLSLFDLIFFWMAFIKICIPIPVPKSQ